MNRQGGAGPYGSNHRSWTAAAIRWLAALLVLGFLAGYLARHWQALRSFHFDIRPGLLSASVVLLCAYFAGRIAIWYVITIRNGVALRPGDTAVAWLYSQAAKYIPGKIFFILSRVYLYERRGKSKTLVALSFVIETAASMAASAAVVFVALVLSDEAALAPYRLFLITALFGLAIILHPRVLQATIDLLGRIRRRPVVALRLTYGTMLRLVALYVLNWSVFGIAFFAFVSSFYDVGVDHLLYLTGSFCLASLVGMLSAFVPSGLGVREGILILTLKQITPVEVAIAVSLAARIWYTLVEASAVGAALVVTGIELPSRRDLSVASLEDVSDQPRGQDGS